MRVRPESHPGADILLAGEAPGAQEEESGKVWVGKAGRELRRYIQKSAKLDVKRFHLTNLVKERPATRRTKGNNSPTAEDIRRDEPELLEELLNVKPSFVVAVGRHAAQWFLGGSASIESCHGFAYPIGDECRAKLVAASRVWQSPAGRVVRGLDEDMSGSRAWLSAQLQNEQPARTTKGRRGTYQEDVRSSRVPVPEVPGHISRPKNRDGAISADWLGRLRVIVVTHPAAGFHDKSSQTQSNINTDFIRLGQIVRGEISADPPVDLFPDPDYYIVRSSIPSFSPRDVAVDTESRLDGSNIWSGQFSFHPGSGAVVRYSDKRLLPQFWHLLTTHRVGMHNAPHDLRVIAKMYGVSIYDLCRQVRFECTMQMAFVYRLLPLALKAIGKRFFGMPVMEYRELVRPADEALAVQYLVQPLSDTCSTCGGVGEFIDMNRTSPKTGKPLQPAVETCPDCEGDGTSWEPPEQQLKWDNKKKRMSISRGQRMGTRIRKALERLDAGTTDTEVDEELVAEGEDKPPAGLQKWWETQVGYEFRQQVEEKYGKIPSGTLADVDEKLAVEYAAKDTDITIRFWPYVEKLLRDEGLWEVYEVDRDAMPMFCQMMEVGWKIDVPYLGELSNELSGRMDVLMHQLEQLAGHYVNPGSSQQVAELLFDEFGLEPVKYTDTGMPSTSDDVLGDLQLQAAGLMDTSKRHRTAWEGLGLIRDHRELSKLKSTYTVKLPRMVDGQDRVHTEIKQAVVESRRPASRNPNLANQPKRGAVAKAVRYAFTCEPGNVLVEVDLEQVEFRVLAHEAGEDELVDAINKGLDPHSLTASKIFGIPLKKVDREGWQRRVSKTANFLILYGGSALLLKSKLKTEAGMDVPVEQCQQWIDDLTSKKGYAKIGEYIEASAAMARRYGYAFDAWGHRRYLPGIYSDLYGVRAEAERVAVNHRIQSYVSGVIKKAMITIWNDVLPVYRAKGYCEPLMQIYDSLVHEVEKKNAKDFCRDVVDVMSFTVQLSVKLTADGKIGERWSELE